MGKRNEGQPIGLAEGGLAPQWPGPGLIEQLDAVAKKATPAQIQEAAIKSGLPIDPPRGDSAKIMVAPLSTRALTEPVKLAREYASAAAAICESPTLQPQSRKNAVKMLRLALELLGE